MAYYLQFDGVDDHVTIPTISLSTNGDYVEFDIDIASGEQQLIGNQVGFANFFEKASNNTSFSLGAGAQARVTRPTSFSAGRQLIRLTKVATGYDLTFNGSGAVTFATSGILSFNNIGGSNGSSFVGEYDLYFLTVNKSGSATNFYDPTATSGTGLVLEDTVGTGTDGTLTNYTGTTNSWWVFYSAGGTITVTGTTANYTYAAISGTVELTGTISVTGATPNYTYSAIAGTIELTPQITVTGATPNYTYTAISGTVESVGIISVTGTTPNYAYTAISGDITLLGTITVTGDTPNYSYSAIRGTIQLGDGVYANSFIGFTPSQGTFNGIVKSSSFNGIINETSDFSGIVKSTTFLGVKE
jgi:hypothetical protein